MPFEFARKVERFKDRQGPGCTTDERAVTTAAAPVVVAAAAAQVEVDVDELDLQLQQVQLGESARVAGAEAAGSEQDQKQQRKPRTRKAEPAAKAPPVFPTPAAVPLPHGPYRVFTFDSETTTLVNAPSPCRFLDLAVVDVDTSACFDTLVDPQCYFRHKDAVHGITPGMVKGQPSAHVALKRMLEFVRARCNSGGGTTTVLVAHNGNRFDFPLLRAESIRCGVELPGDWLCLDTLVLARKLSLRQRAGAERQGQLLGFYGIPCPDDAHRALPDARSLAQLFTAMLTDAVSCCSQQPMPHNGTAAPTSTSGSSNGAAAQPPAGNGSAGGCPALTLRQLCELWPNLLCRLADVTPAKIVEPKRRADSGGSHQAAERAVHARPQENALAEAVREAAAGLSGCALLSIEEFQAGCVAGAIGPSQAEVQRQAAQRTRYLPIVWRQNGGAACSQDGQGGQLQQEAGREHQAGLLQPAGQPQPSGQQQQQQQEQQQQVTPVARALQPPLRPLLHLQRLCVAFDMSPQWAYGDKDQPRWALHLKPDKGKGVKVSSSNAFQTLVACLGSLTQQVFQATPAQAKDCLKVSLQAEVKRRPGGTPQEGHTVEWALLTRISPATAASSAQQQEQRDLRPQLQSCNVRSGSAVGPAASQQQHPQHLQHPQDRQVEEVKAANVSAVNRVLGKGVKLDVLLSPELLWRQEDGRAGVTLVAHHLWLH